MTSRTYATLNANALGDGLSLDQGNLVVTTNADGLDFHRAVFGTQPKGTGQMYFETYFYSTSRPTGGLVNLLSVGVNGRNYDKIVAMQPAPRRKITP